MSGKVHEVRWWPKAYSVICVKCFSSKVVEGLGLYCVFGQELGT
jgi:hypothetical protein